MKYKIALVGEDEHNRGIFQMAEKPYVVVVESKDGVIYSARFVTMEAASAAAEFWSIHGAAAVIEDQKAWPHRSE
jgi:hypothetical protein